MQSIVRNIVFFFAIGAGLTGCERQVVMTDFFGLTYSADEVSYEVPPKNVLKAFSIEKGEKFAVYARAEALNNPAISYWFIGREQDSLGLTYVVECFDSGDSKVLGPTDALNVDEDGLSLSKELELDLYKDAIKRAVFAYGGVKEFQRVLQEQGVTESALFKPMLIDEMRKSGFALKKE